MKFSKKLIERLVIEEIANYVKELAEDEKKPETQDSEEADSEKPPAAKKPAEKVAPNDDPTMDADKAPGSPPEEEEAEVPDEEDPADDELEDERADGEGDDDRGGGKVADEVVGKRIQSITMEPKSKIVPGAMEIVVTFEEMPQPLKILVTKTGQVKYFLNGLHDAL